MEGKTMKRYILLFMLILCASISATAQRITAEFRDTSLPEALTELERQCEDMQINFIYDDLKDYKVTQSIDNLLLKEAIHAVVGNYPIRVSKKKNKYYLNIVPAPPIKISGLVQDGFLKRIVPDLKVSLCHADSTLLQDSLRCYVAYDGGKAVAKLYGTEFNAQDKEYLIHAEARGYGDEWHKVRISNNENGVIKMPTIDMRKVFELKEVEVVATRVKMFYKGDTLVYDATAFQLPDGSMLDELIRQLPGVTMNSNGEIFVNGRKIDELLLGARSFMGGNKKVLLENLPYYTVKNVKVYEKQSDRSVAAGFDLDPRSYVMDVNLKDEYKTGYIANAEVAGGTEERYLARAFLLGFTDKTRYSAMANINNVNETRHMGNSGNWSPEMMPTSMTTTHSAAVDIDYKGDEREDHFWGNYSSNSTKHDMQQQSEQFLVGANPHSRTQSASRNGTHSFDIHNLFVLPKPFQRFNIDFDHASRDGSFNSSFDQWNDTLIASKRSIGMSEGKAWNINFSAFGKIYSREKSKIWLNYDVSYNHNDDLSRQAARYQTTLQTEDINRTQHNTNDLLNRKDQASANLHYNMDFGKTGWGIILDETYRHTVKANRDYLYHPDSLLMPSQIDALVAFTDYNNSYESHKTTNYFEFHTTIYKLVKREVMPGLFGEDYQWKFAFTLPYISDNMSYKRGVIDTIVSRKRLLPCAFFWYQEYWNMSKRKLSVDGGYSYLREGSDIIQNMVDFRDDSQPLIVRYGNPNLTEPSRASLNFGFNDQPQHGMLKSYWINASAHYYLNSVAESVIYNPQSGVYTYRPVNISGNYDIQVHPIFSGKFTEKSHWSWQTSGVIGYQHLLDYSMLEGETESHLGAVNTFTLRDRIAIDYQHKALSLSIWGFADWSHSTGRLYDFSSLSAIDIRYGANARYMLPKLKTTLSLDATMYSRRGYGSSDLNTDDFVMNASLSQPFFKGKLIARLEAFDILHQLSNTQYAVNAQGRTITWYRSLPHYVMLHAVYHWNKNPKKKK